MAEQNTDTLRPFYIIRNSDSTGVSGTGHVLDGVIFPNGKVVVCWRGEVTSIVVYDSFEMFQNIHIIPHPENDTEIVFYTLKEQIRLDQDVKIEIHEDGEASHSTA